MPRTITSLTIFLSSPSDLSLERQLISRAVDTANRTIRNIHDVRFELWKWEDDAMPGISSSSQTVIDQQVPEHDVYLGLMWKRFGSPTHKSGSGTEHEFRSSLESYKRGEPPKHILFLFKTELGSLQELDAEEYLKVEAFKRSLGDLGVLYSSFADSSELERMLQMQLVRIAAAHGKDSPIIEVPAVEASQDIVSKAQLTILANATEAAPNWQLMETEELGFLDFDEICESGLADATEMLTQLSTAMGEMGTSLGRRTDEINNANSDISSRTTQVTRSIINSAAEDISRFLMLSKPLVFQARAKFEESFDALTGSLSLRQGLPKNAEKDAQLRNLQHAVGQLVSAIEGTDLTMTQMRSSVSGIPKATSKLNKACRGMLLFIDDYFSMSGKLRSMSHNALSIIGQML